MILKFFLMVQIKISVVYFTTLAVDYYGNNFNVLTAIGAQNNELVDNVVCTQVLGNCMCV